MHRRNAAPFIREAQHRHCSTPQHCRATGNMTTMSALSTENLLDAVNSDCLLLILSFLPIEDLNTFAFCSRHYRDARRHASLNQTRTGTVVLSEETSLGSFFNNIQQKEWNRAFSGDRTRLTLEGEWKRKPDLQREYPAAEMEQLRACLNHVQLTGVTSLALSYDKKSLLRVEHFKLSWNIVWALSNILPNLREVDLSGVAISPRVMSLFLTNCPILSQMTYCSSVDGLLLDGRDLKDAANLSDLTLDGSRFCRVSAASFMSDSASNNYLLMHCPRLERLSIKNANTWQNADHPNVCLEQDMLMKLVRLHPALGCIRCDLTEENVAILKRERPEVTIVTN